MKILVIDNISYRNHKYFNRLHMETLLELGHYLHLVGRQGHFDNVEVSDNVRKSIVPELFYSDNPLSSLTVRIRWICCLIWLRYKFNPKNYDAVLILTYDPMSIFAYRTNKPVMLFTHDGHYLDNKVKLFALKCTPKHYIHICLNKGMEKHLRELLPNRKVCYIPHGLYKPSNNYQVPKELTEGDAYLFCPINMNYDQKFVKILLNCEEFHNYLKNKALKLYVKKQLLEESTSPLIIPIENDLLKSEYDYYIQHATAVIIPYDNNYKYRTSGIMLECVIRDTPVLTTKLEAMEEYEGVINLRMFDNVNELIDGIDYFIKNDLIKVDKTLFQPLPYWRDLFTNYFNVQS